MKRISIFGSTGSIGSNCLNVLESHPEEFEVRYLTANRNVELLYEQARRFRPKAVAIFDERKIPKYASKFRDLDVEVLDGFDGILELSGRDDVDLFVNALVGAAGLRPTLNALNKKRRVALANKETLVIGGQLVMQKAHEIGAEVIPIDSEHSAILQCLAGEEHNPIRTIILTASGGPFRNLASSKLARVSVQQALNHPNWDMGPKITIDSSTLMNKGLEVIEAYWLFDVAPNQIEVVIHPQSIIHSMVEFEDGSIKAQLGVPDMRLPIQYALTFPKRFPADHLPRLDIRSLHELTFAQPDTNKFVCLRLCYEALASGGAAPVVLNAANEEAVHLFLNEKISFEKIPQLVENALSEIQYNGYTDVQELLYFDKLTREYVQNRFVSL
ncbi:MAG: 1-deoxy-D-xylulose-5-phosphate reductoisomerase [bacterium]